MATKDNFLSFKDKYKSFNYCHTDTGAQYSDLNLNQNLKGLNIFPIQSNSKSHNDKTIDYALSERYEEKEKSQTWKKSSVTDLSSKYSSILSLNDGNEKCWKKNATNNSTLSLRISAYENSNEASSDSLNKSFQKSLFIQKQKQINPASKFVSQSPFEFQRQQNDKVSEPEVSQFKASQRLLNLNKSDLHSHLSCSPNSSLMDFNVTEQHSDFDMKEGDQENDQDQNSTIGNENENGIPEHETSIASNGTEIVSPDREYFFGHDKLHGGRMWIQAFNDRTKYNLYALYNQDENGDLYKCIQCTRYEHRGHKPSSITVRHRPDGTAELSEKRNHYPSCNHDKSFIDKIQKKYHRTPKSANNDLPKPKPRPSLQKPSTTKPALQTQVFSNASPEDSRKRRSARLSQNESDIDANPSVPSPPVVAKPVFIKPSSAAPSSARRSRTQAVRIPVTSQNSRVIRDDSVASNFSHLIPSYQARTNANPSPLSRPIAAFSKANPVVIPLKPIDLGPFPTNARISTPPQPHIPTPPLLHQNGTSSVDLANIPFLQPKTLAYNESICHCIPSSHNLREMSALLGLEYKSQSQAFWHSTYIINEITGRAKASITQNITMQRNLGFQAISMFLTSSEESTFKIQESIKQYIFTNLQNLVAKNNVSYNHLMQTALCSYQLENVHLWVLTKIMNVRIVVFSSEGVQVFGDAFDDSLPSILLKKNNGEYLPVLSVQK